MNKDVGEGVGCLLYAVAFLLVLFLLSIGDHLVTFVNHWLEMHS